MADYKTYLATNILSEDKTVTYRLLSRALKVHVNTAKEMLYEFHRSQNAKKPNTLHATYLVSGTKPATPLVASSPQALNGNTQKKDGEDDYMQSSPYMPSSALQVEEQDENAGAVSVTTITLVREEELEEIKSQYIHISSIHMYSLSPSRIPDLQLLSEVTRQLRVLTSTDDPLSTYSAYGTITNPLVKRRTGRRPPPLPVAAPIKAAPSKPAPTKSEPPKLTRQDSSRTSQISNVAKDFFGKGKDKPKAGAHAVPPGNIGESGTSSKEGTPAPPATLKREGSSIFKAFAKTKEPTKKATKKKEEQEDVAMSDDGEDDGEEVHVVVPPTKKKAKTEEEETGESRNRRKEREAQLKKMMDDSDEEDSAPASKVETPNAAEEDEDVEMNDSPAEEEPPKQQVKQEEPVFEAANEKRRARRRILKKVTVKDEEGYLVTREEQAWESYSEAEEEVAASKVKAKPVTANVASVKAKKPVAKTGQGNIMSFFGKK